MKAFFTLVLIAVLAVGGWLAWALWMPVAPQGQQFVLLHPGYSTRRIATELKSAGVIRSANVFILWHYLHHGHSLKAGEYLFEHPATALQVHERLARGDIYVHTVVVPEGYNMFEIAQAVQDAGLGSRDEFLNIVRSDVNLVSDLAPEAKSLEGYLFPDTYQFTRTQTMTDIVETMVKKFRQVARQIGLNSDVQRVVTMASIVEKETAAPEERPMVASVYYNRLAKNVALDADPSVIYAELLNGSYSGSLHHDDLAFNSPYNTYKYPGLPPGPIASPGKSALEAAMHPTETDYFYFVGDGNGHHRFAASLEEHNHNVALLRRAVAGR